MRILGCWYSTARIHPQILQSSLRSLEAACAASHRSQPLVKTCNWERIPGNPFDEYIAHHPQANHLGIVMQVARILFEEQQAGREHAAVCFLEHDVLYPHDYFDQIAATFAEHRDIQGVFNENYIGLNHAGWQFVRHRREPPLHQLSLRWDFARNHIESLIRRCILHRAIPLEPEVSPPIVRRALECVGPACHMNHRRHFTDHHDCYENPDPRSDVHPYWGHFRQYYPSDAEKPPQLRAESPIRCGVVIGHFHRVDFLELNLRAIRKHCGPDVPILVSDDCTDGFGVTPSSGSLFERVLALAETIPHVVVWPNVTRIGHTGGDMAAFWKGLVWGKQMGLDVVFKLSQRYVINCPNWIEDSARQLIQSGRATLGRPCAHGGWPIRTEAVGLYVPTWHRPDVLAHLTPRRVDWPTELIIWDDIVDRLDGQLQPWNMVTEGRFTPTPHALFHYANTPQDYARLAEELGMSSQGDFDCDQLANYLFG